MASIDPNIVFTPVLCAIIETVPWQRIEKDWLAIYSKLLEREQQICDLIFELHKFVSNQNISPSYGSPLFFLSLQGKEYDEMLSISDSPISEDTLRNIYDRYRSLEPSRNKCESSDEANEKFFDCIVEIWRTDNAGHIEQLRSFVSGRVHDN